MSPLACPSAETREMLVVHSFHLRARVATLLAFPWSCFSVSEGPSATRAPVFPLCLDSPGLVSVCQRGPQQHTRLRWQCLDPPGLEVSALSNTRARAGNAAYADQGRARHLHAALPRPRHRGYHRHAHQGALLWWPEAVLRQTER